MRFEEWLHQQRRYQEQVYNVDYAGMDADPKKLTDYVTMNLYAAVHEIVEAGQETPWKPWASVDKGEYWEKHRLSFVNEVVDVLFFLGNALAAVGCTDEELAFRYQQKMTINAQRQQVGYTGDNKCSECGRAFDDEGNQVVITWVTGEKFCNASCQTNHLIEKDAWA